MEAKVDTQAKASKQANKPTWKRTLKGRHLRQLEIGRKQLFEFLGLADHKAPSVGLPGDDIAVSVGFHFVQHFVQAEGKRHGHTSSGGPFVNGIRLGGVVVVVVFHHNVRMAGAVFATLALGGAAGRWCCCCCCLGLDGFHANSTGVEWRLYWKERG